MKRILLSLVTIGAIGVTAVAFSGAFFSDTETSTGNVLSAGTLDLQIDNTSFYNNVASPNTSWVLGGAIKKFFDFNDVKPGDVGEDTISIHVNDNDSWLCADVTLTSDDENGIQPVESIDGDVTDGSGSGELADHINFIWWADDGDNVLEDGETVLPGGPLGALDVGETSNVTLADSSGSIWGSGPLPGNTTKYIGKAWCFGTLTPAPLPQDGVNNLVTPANTSGGVSCDGSGEGNETQTDSLTADISFSAVQSRHNPDFVCGQDEVTPTPTPAISNTPTPTPIACVEAFASSASNNNQGTRKDGSAVLANRSVPSAMFGAPQTSGADSDVGFPAGSFFSLGFTNGNIVVGFSNPFFPNPSGADLQVFEVTGGTYPDEKVKVEVGPSAAGPWDLVSAAAVRDEDLELPGSVVSAQFVRLTDVSDISLFPDDADAYDVDAVKALCGQPE